MLLPPPKSDNFYSLSRQHPTFQYAPCPVLCSIISSSPNTSLSFNIALPVPCAALPPVCVLPLCITGGRHDNITLPTNPPPKCSARLHLICMLSQQPAAFDFDNKGVRVTPAKALYSDPWLFLFSRPARHAIYLISVIRFFQSFCPVVNPTRFIFSFTFVETYKRSELIKKV